MPNPFYTYYIWFVNAELIDNIFKQAWAHFLPPVKWLYTWFISQWFVGNFIFKWVKANLSQTSTTIVYIQLNGFKYSNTNTSI